MRTFVLITLGLSAAVSACQAPGPAPMTMAEREAIADTIRQLSDQFFTDFRSLDFEAAMAPYSSDIVWAEQGHLGANRDSLEAAWSGFFESIREVTSGDWEEVHVRVLGPDAAVYTASYSWAGTDLNGEPVGGPGVWTTVWVRSDQGWRIVQGHESYPVAESGEM